MIRSFFSSSVGALALLAGCAGTVGSVDDADLGGEETTSDALTTSSDSFVTIRRDFRRCVSPLCGGYFAKDANGTTETYVNALDFSRSGLDQATIDQATGGNGPTEIILKGRLGAKESRFNTRPLVVKAAYRGMPGQEFPATDRFFQVAPRSPQINCFTAPCPNLTAKALNTNTKTNVDRLDVTDALGALVDGAWLASQVTEHGALVAGTIVSGAQFPGGKEKVVASHQVFLKLPYQAEPCPMFKIASCPEGQTRTYTRDANRCLIPSACVEGGACAAFVPSCDEGYTQTSYTGGRFACTTYACDPTFTVE